MTEAPQSINTLFPASPTIEALRAELAACETMTLQMGVLPLIDAARAVIDEHDTQLAYVKAMMEIPRPTAAQIHEQLMADQSPNIVNTAKVDGYWPPPEQPAPAQPVGQAKGTLDP